MPQTKTKIFSSHPGALVAQPSLIEIQTDSYAWFLTNGVQEVLKEVTPIKDYTGKNLELHFGKYAFDEPKYTEDQARVKDLSYESPLRVEVTLINHKTGKTKSQEIYLGDIPLMTKRGTFIINGVERVVVSQLIRSPGVYFTMDVWRGRKLFGAKVIPGRGSWLELESESDGFIGAKIDRHRKVPVTELLRVFGMTDEDLIRRTFKDVDTGEVKHIETTLRKDPAKTLDESYIEIYRRIRPGDLATAKNAQGLIDGMFRRADRYDLSRVGRFKANQRLQSYKPKTASQLLELEDVINMIKEVIRLNNDPSASPDDIDHLGNRRIKGVGELLQERVRIGFMRIRRIVQDRMSTLGTEDLAVQQLINTRPLVSSIREFFTSSQLSQFMGQVNPLEEVEHKRRISARGPGGLTPERASFEVRNVHYSHYGRICPIQTPEGPNIGLINSLAGYARLNEFGFLETPYAKVAQGKVTKEIEYLDALEEERHNIAHAGVHLNPEGEIINTVIEARVHGQPGTCMKSEVDFIDVSPNQFLSIAAALIPFFEHDDANRALMGSNMQRQAVVTLRAEAPHVSTGAEEKVARESGRMILAEHDGTVTLAEADHINVTHRGGTDKYALDKFKRSNQFTCISQRALVRKGQKVKKGDILADGPAVDHGVLALGQNLLVAFVPWYGANFEDAIVISEKVVHDDRFTSIHIEDYDCDVRDTKLGPEITTPDIPNVSEARLKNLDEEGIVRVGAEVASGDILVGKISPKGESELTSEERLLRAIFGEKARDVKDTSLTLPHGKHGRIIGIKVFSREKGDNLEPGVIKRVRVEIAQLRKLMVGDKLAGRHGNKGVISTIRPVQDMPYLEDGTPVDIVLNPLGVASRMNLGQILETHLGWASEKLGYRAITPALAGASEDEIRRELEAAGIPRSGQVRLFDGRTGESFDRPVTVGSLYILKLNHLVEDKIHMRSIGPYSLITQQPLGGKAQFGGQRFGEMEVWALEGYGAAHVLQEMLTIKSDDIMGRSSAYEAIIRGEEIKQPNIPASFNVLVNELKALGLNIELLRKEEEEETR